MANTDEIKTSAGVFGTSADELLRGLNAQYKEDTIVKDIAENNGDIDPEQLENAANSAFESAQIDMSSLSDAEFKFLFDSYLASSHFDMSLRETDYENLHKHIINIQKKSGAKILSYDEMKESVFDGCSPAKEQIFADEEPEFPFEEEHFEHKTPEEMELFRPDTESYDIVQEEQAEDNNSLEEEEPVVIEEKPKKRKKSIFAWLKSLMHEDEAEEVVSEPEPEILDGEMEQTAETTVFDTILEKDSFDSEINENEIVAQEAYEENTYSEEPLEEALNEDEEELLEEEIPEEISEEISAQIPDEIFEDDDEEIYDDDISPTEEILENHIEDTSLLDSYEPEIEEPEELPDDDDGITEETEAMMTDTAMMKAFGIDSRRGTENEIPKDIFDETAYTTLETTSETEVQEEPEKEDPNEYNSFEQNKELFAAYKHKYNFVRIRMAICAVFAVFLFAIENIGIFGASLPAFMQTAAGYATVEWALLFVCALLVCENLISAAKSLAKFNFTPDSVLLISFFMSIVTSAVAIFAGGKNMKMFNFPFAVCVLFCLLATFISVRKEIFTFKIISSRKNKYAVTLMKNGKKSPEAIEFAEHMTEKAQAYSVVNADFVDGYLSRKREKPSSYKQLRVLIPVIFAFSVAFGLVSAFVAEAGVYGSVSNAYAAFLMCAPAAVFLSYELPVYMSSVRAYSNASAIIGDVAPEMVEKMAVITLSDNDAFGKDGVRIKGVKVIENNKIENVIYYASAACSLVGGPLAKVFKQATLDASEPENVELRVLSDMGIDTMVDGKHIVLGVPQYMDAQCFQTIYETGDEHWEGKTNRRILYLACDEEIIAKFYIEYKVSSDFHYLVKHLCEAGICVSVRSNDPCIDTDIFYKNKLSPEEYPLRVIKGERDDTTSRRVKAKNAAIVSTGSVKGLVKSILLCDRIQKVSKVNFVIKAVSALIGAVIMGVLIFTDTYTDFWSVYPALFQAFWAIPFYLISKFYI
ncbi:MAG: hypothetical protein J6D11_05940 [Clostridia bacterium]|nr:hypothetical protein [Clostridia bacterium]